MAQVISPLFFAHVRAAGPSMAVNESCCHPMQSGRYLFMHNGGIGGFSIIVRRLISKLDAFAHAWLMQQGACTDSMVAFALFLSHVGGDATTLRSPETLRRWMNSTIGIIAAVSREAGVSNVSLLNFVLADGDAMLSTRYVRGGSGAAGTGPTPPAASLYYSTGTRFQCVNASVTGESLAFNGGENQYRMMHTGAHPAHHAADGHASFETGCLLCSLRACFPVAAANSAEKW